MINNKHNGKSEGLFRGSLRFANFQGTSTKNGGCPLQNHHLKKWLSDTVTCSLCLRHFWKPFHFRSVKGFCILNENLNTAHCSVIHQDIYILRCWLSTWILHTPKKLTKMSPIKGAHSPFSKGKNYRFPVQGTFVRFWGSFLLSGSHKTRCGYDGQ